VAKGRPSSFTPEIADEICEKLIDGKSLRSICCDPAMPGVATVCRWLAANDEFRKQYARAREAQADTLADEIVDIADDGSNDYMGEDDKYNGDAVQRSKLRVDARKWVAAKLKPKKYGEKIDVTSGGEKIEPDEITRATRLAAIFSELDKRNAPDESS
jgi:hypothetical protein